MVVKKVVYVADIGADIDDMIAVEYLFLKKALDYVVLDRDNIADMGRVESLKAMGVDFKSEIQHDCKSVFVGGALTKVASFLEGGNDLDFLVIQGGFAGANIVTKPLKKFKNKTEVRTFNLNIDVHSSLSVLRMKKQVMNQILFVSKNVCHSSINTEGDLHKDSFLKKYKLSPTKRLHDLLAVKEGLMYMGAKDILLCHYENVKLVCNGTDEYAKWSSMPSNCSDVLISTSFKEKLFCEKTLKNI